MICQAARQIPTYCRGRESWWKLTRGEYHEIPHDTIICSNMFKQSHFSSFLQRFTWRCSNRMGPEPSPCTRWNDDRFECHIARASKLTFLSHLHSRSTSQIFSIYLYCSTLDSFDVVKNGLPKVVQYLKYICYSQLPKSWRNPKNLEISLGEGFCGSRGDAAFSLCLG